MSRSLGSPVIKSDPGLVATEKMKIDWPVLIAAFFAISASYVFLLKTMRGKNHELDRLETENKLLRGDVLQTRSEHARQIADLTTEHAKQITALQHNMNDLTALLKERAGSGRDGWPAKQQR